MPEIKTILTIKANGPYCDKSCWPGHICQFGLKEHGAMRSKACLEAEREYAELKCDADRYRAAVESCKNITEHYMMSGGFKSESEKN